MEICNFSFKKLLKLYSLFIINNNCNNNFTEFQNDKINHIGEILLWVNENNIENIIKTLENKRSKYEKDLKFYKSNKITNILIEEVSQWKIKLQEINNLYTNYLNKNITEKIFLEESSNILIDSLNNIKIALAKNNINNEYINIINKLIEMSYFIKKDKNFSLKTLINIINKSGILLLKISYIIDLNSTNNNSIIEIIKIFDNYIKIHELNLKNISELLFILEKIIDIININLENIEIILNTTFNKINYITISINTSNI